MQAARDADLSLFAGASFDAVVSFMALMDGPRFDRTLSEYVNPLIAAGFMLEEIQEPRPSEEYCRAHPSQGGRRDHVALFLRFRAGKPASIAGERSARPPAPR